MASPPTTTPPLLGNATTDGCTRSPRAPRMNSTPVSVAIAATEFVVPRSMPRATATLPKCYAKTGATVEFSYLPPAGSDPGVRTGDVGPAAPVGLDRGREQVAAR